MKFQFKIIFTSSLVVLILFLSVLIPILRLQQDRNFDFIASKIIDEDSATGPIINSLKLNETYQEIGNNEKFDINDLMHDYKRINSYYKAKHTSVIPIAANSSFIFNNPTNFTFEVNNSIIKNILELNHSSVQWKSKNLPLNNSASTRITLLNEQKNFTRISQETSNFLVISNFSITDWDTKKILSPKNSPLILNLSLRNFIKNYTSNYLEYLFFIELSFKTNKSAVPEYDSKLLRVFIDYNSPYLDLNDYKRTNTFTELGIETGLKDNFDLDIYSQIPVSNDWINLSFNISEIFQYKEKFNPDLVLSDYFNTFSGFNIGMLTRNSSEKREISYDISSLSLYNDLQASTNLEIKTTKKFSNITITSKSNIGYEYICLNCKEIKFSINPIDDFKLDKLLLKGNLPINFVLFVYDVIDVKSSLLANDTIFWAGETLPSSFLTPISKNIIKKSNFWFAWYDNELWSLVNDLANYFQENISFLNPFFNLTTNDLYFNDLKIRKFMPNDYNTSIIWKHANTLNSIYINQKIVDFIPKIEVTSLMRIDYPLVVEMYLISNFNTLYFNFNIPSYLNSKTLIIPWIPEQNITYTLIIKSVNSNLLGIRKFFINIPSKQSLITNFIKCQDPTIPQMIVSGTKIGFNINCNFISNYITQKFWNRVYFNLNINNSLLSTSQIRNGSTPNSILVNNFGYWPNIKNSLSNAFNLSGELIYFSNYFNLVLYEFNQSIEMLINQEEVINNQDIPGAIPTYLITISIFFILIYIKKKAKIHDLGKDDN